MTVPAELSLETLMERYANGSAEAFNELYRRTAPKLYGYLLRLSRDEALAEDVLQATFIKLHRARDAYLPGSAFVPWILVIARRTFFDERRSSVRRWEVLSEDGALPDVEVQSDASQITATQDLQRALRELPSHYRDAIELTKLAGLSGSEAARALNTTKSAVKLRVHRGYHVLRRLLESEPEAGAPDFAAAATAAAA